MATVKDELEKILSERIMIFDGGMGSMIQDLCLSEEDYRGGRFRHHKTPLKGNNDLLTLTQPEKILNIHKMYLEAGCDFIETNTFNSNCIVQQDYQLQQFTYELNYKAALLAREAIDTFTTTDGNKKYVVGSIGPTNKSLSISSSNKQAYTRDITFDELVEAYEQQIEALLDGKVDVLMIETIFDTANAKAACYAIQNELEKNKFKNMQKIPVFISATINDKSGRLLCGQTCQAFIISLQHINPMCIGLNCGFGASGLREYISSISRFTNSFTICCPNAGLPNTFGKYEDSASLMSQQLRQYALDGIIDIIGGCCGTTPAHIKLIREAMQGIKPRKPPVNIYKDCLLLSGLDEMIIDKTSNFVNIGERCNVTGHKYFAQLIKDGNFEDALDVAKEQVLNGAQILDINFDDGLLNGKLLMKTFINLIASDPSVSRIPICIDSSSFDVIVEGLKCSQGKCIVNSLSLKDGEKSMIEKVKVVQRFGAAIIVMAFDEDGQANSFEDKVRISERAYNLMAHQLHVSPCDIIFDPGVLTIGTGMKEHEKFAMSFIQATSVIKRRLKGVRVVGGISNLSFSFRGLDVVRRALHSVFLFHAIKAGLDIGIVNAGSLPVYDVIPKELLRNCENLIWNRSKTATDELIAFGRTFEGEEEPKEVDEWRNEDVEERLIHSLFKGIDKFVVEDSEACRLKLGESVLVIEGPLMKGMKKVGDMFADGKMFLPQVIKSARVMKKCVSHLLPFITRSSMQRHWKGTIIIATVSGDVHDIGKNIVSVVLGCNNFRVIDLGVMVPHHRIIATAIQEEADVIGVSGLVTPSLQEMVEVAKEMERQKMKIPLLIGGAATSKTHTALMISPKYSGPCIHVTDASRSVIVCTSLLDEKSRDRFVDEITTDYDVIRQEYESFNQSDKLVSIEKARRLSPRFDLNLVPDPPSFLGTRVFRNFEITSVVDFIDWKSYFDVWQLRGKYPNSRFPKIFRDRHVGEEARQLFDDAQALLNDVINNKLLRLNGVVGFYEANSHQDDIILYEVTNAAEEIATLHGLRQQRVESGFCRCISDFIAPKSSSLHDHLGLFVVTCQGGMELSEKLKKDLNDYKSILVKAVCDRLVEAFAECLHHKVRTQLWSYSKNEVILPKDMYKMQYKGIRPAPGYPIQPDHTEKKIIWELMNVEEVIGVKLTKSFAMDPASSVCGIYFANPNSSYFSVGKIDEDQIIDYSRRKNLEKKEIEKWMQANLTYKNHDDD